MKEKKPTIPAKKYSKNYKFGKATWEEGTIDKRIGKILYLIKYPKLVIKRRLNKLKRRYKVEVDQCKEEPMIGIYDMFEISVPQPVQVSESEFQCPLWK